MSTSIISVKSIKSRLVEFRVRDSIFSLLMMRRGFQAQHDRVFDGEYLTQSQAIILELDAHFWKEIADLPDDAERIARVKVFSEEKPRGVRLADLARYFAKLGAIDEEMMAALLERRGVETGADRLLKEESVDGELLAELRFDINELISVRARDGYVAGWMQGTPGGILPKDLIYAVENLTQKPFSRIDQKDITKILKEAGVKIRANGYISPRALAFGVRTRIRREIDKFRRDTNYSVPLPEAWEGVKGVTRKQDAPRIALKVSDSH